MMLPGESTSGRRSVRPDGDVVAEALALGFSDQDAITGEAVTSLGWQPGDPCGACGSRDTVWIDDVTGAHCLSCGRYDDDE